MRMTGARALVRQLEREGVRHAFTVPGESFLAVLDALRDTSAIGLVATRHEGGAAFMAEAIGKLTGQPALCIGTRGVGSTNMAIALHTAHQDSTPLIALIGQVETPYRQREAFQEIDLTAFYAHITKWTVEINRPERAPELIHEAVRRAIGGRPGPVLIAAPTDVLNAEAEFAPHDFRGAAVAPRPAPSAGDLARVLELLAGARRPVMLVGGGVLAAGATDDLVAFAEATSIPVLTAFRRYHAFPNWHPLYLGGLGVGAPPVVAARLREADVVLAIGTRFSAITTRDYALPAPGAQTIHIDIDPDVVGVNRDIALGIVADASEALRALHQAYQANTGATPETRLARQALAERDRAAFDAVATPHAVADHEPVDPTGVVVDLQRLLPPETIVTGDAGNFWHWFARYYRFSQPGAFLGPTSGAMGYAIPAAIGAALARPGTPTVALAGDGGFLMTGQELETAVRCELPVIALAFNNRSYGTIRMHQEREYPDRVSATDLGPVDFALFARSLGAHGERVTTNRDFAPALERALALGRPAVLDVITDPDLIAIDTTIADLRRQHQQHQ